MNSIQSSSEYKKKVNSYIISYCKADYYGSSLHGEMRTGLSQLTNKVYIFRVNALPLSISMSKFMSLQETYSKLDQYSRICYDEISSCSSKYNVLQYFPKTFASEIQNFRKNRSYFTQFVEKFLKTYSFFYNMKIAHGNLIQQNIGITFDGKVKFMDFQILPNKTCKQSFHKDFVDFKLFVSKVLQKDDHYPYKFDCFNTQNTMKWEALFSSWHIVSPLEPVYMARPNYVDNIVRTLRYLEQSLDQIYEQQNKSEIQVQTNHTDKYKLSKCNLILSQSESLRIIKTSLNLLQQSYIQNHEAIKQALPLRCLQQSQIEYYNSILMGIIQDPQYFRFDVSRRLVLISCLVIELNHQFIYFQITQQFKNNHQKRNQLLGDSLFCTYKQQIFSNLIKIKYK